MDQSSRGWRVDRTPRFGWIACSAKLQLLSAALYSHRATAEKRRPEKTKGIIVMLLGIGGTQRLDPRRIRTRVHESFFHVFGGQSHNIGVVDSF
jgi:hypothetical protein